MDSYTAVERIVTESYSRLRAIVATHTGDLAAAEDALGDALYAALRQWPQQGVPRAPEAWLLAVARRRLMDEVRRQDTRAVHEPALRRAAEAGALAVMSAIAGLETIPDERLKLLFACAHPGIEPGLHTPLMLQAVLGVNAARIASAFLVAPATMSQRLVRAKTKIRQAGIPFRVPDANALPERLDAVLDAIYAAYGLDWGMGADALQRGGMISEAIFLARLLAGLLPDEPETKGLLALMLHCEARRAARRDARDEYVPLGSQDPSRWSRPMMEEAENLLGAAAEQHRPGRFQLEAAIQSAHATRARTGETPWPGILALYRELLAVAPSVGAQVAYAAALHQSGDAAAAEQELAALPAQITVSYQPYWAVRAQVSLSAGRTQDARAAFARAAGLTQDEATRRFLSRLSADPAT